MHLINKIIFKTTLQLQCCFFKQVIVFFAETTQ